MPDNQLQIDPEALELLSLIGYISPQPDITATAPLPVAPQADYLMARDVSELMAANPAAMIEAQPEPWRGRKPDYESKYWEMSDEDKRMYDLASKYIPPEQLSKTKRFSGVSAPYTPYGVHQGIAQSYAEGITGREATQGVEGASPTANLLAGLAGEGVKYGTLYRGATAAGLPSIPAWGIAGLTSGAVREDATAEGALYEGVVAGAIPGFTKAVVGGLSPEVATQVSKVAPVNKYAQVGRAVQAEVTPLRTDLKLPPMTPDESVSLAFFGYTPEMARATRIAIERMQTKWSNAVDAGVEKMVSVVPENIRTYLRNQFVSPAPPGVRQGLKEMRVGRERGRMAGQEFGKMIREQIPESEQLEAFKTLDPTAFGELGDIPKYPALAVARDKIDELGRQFVDYGLLDEKLYAKNVGKYLSRYYTKHEGDKSLFGFAKKIGKITMKGRQLKRRTLQTAEQREKAGLITDPAYAVSRTVGDLTYDLEAFKFFRKIAQNPEWSSDIKDLRFTKHIPNDKTKYGDLAGRWVDGGTFDELSFIVDSRSDFGKIYDRLLGAWKYGKTALNPATHGRNVFSNFVLADQGGLSPLRVDVYAKALREYTKKGPLFKEAAEQGLFGSDWYFSEVKSFIRPMGRGSGSMFERMWDVVSDSKVGKLTEAAGNLYQAEEHWFKMASYMHQRAKGASIEQATAHAQKYLFDYSDLPPIMKRLRRSPFGGPFLSFTYKALPVMAESAIKHPIRFWKYFAGLKAMNEISKVQLGMTDKDYEDLRQSLPEWQRTGFKTLLPIRDKNGNPIIWDLTYNMPWGDIGEQGTLIDIPVVGPVVERFVGGNPALRLPVELMMNKDAFRGKEIYTEELDENLPSGMPGLSQRREKQLRHIGRGLAPGIALNVPPVIESIVGAKKKSGEDVDPMVTALKSLVGLKFASVNQKTGTRIKFSQIKKRIDKIQSRMISIQLDKSISDEERKREMNKLRDEIMRIIKEDIKELTD